ncbi:MAG: hypothetical protein HS101_08550 [Planctomycetia bacterium]|nr:hypothetical protein [Planctomycetia bacterium]
MHDDPVSFDIPVERSAAMMRALWRLMVVAVMVGLMSIVRPDWRLLRLTDSASFFAMVVVMVLLGALSAWLFYTAMRWLILACWPKHVGMRVGPDAIELHLGPFGEWRYLWTDIAADYGNAMEPEVLAAMPDNALTPRLMHRKDGDLFTVILRFSRIDTEDLANAMTPFVRHRGRE